MIISILINFILLIRKSRCIIHDIISLLKRRYYALYEAFRRLINLKKTKKEALPGFSRSVRRYCRRATAVLLKDVTRKAIAVLRKSLICKVAQISLGSALFLRKYREMAYQA